MANLEEHLEILESSISRHGNFVTDLDNLFFEKGESLREGDYLVIPSRVFCENDDLIGQISKEGELVLTDLTRPTPFGTDLEYFTSNALEISNAKKKPYRQDFFNIFPEFDLVISQTPNPSNITLIKDALIGRKVQTDFYVKVIEPDQYVFFQRSQLLNT